MPPMPELWGRELGTRPCALPFQPLAALGGQWKGQPWHPCTSQRSRGRCFCSCISCDGEMALRKVLRGCGWEVPSALC